MDYSALLERFCAGVIIGDGALGTRLQQVASTPVGLPEMLVLDAPGRDAIRRVHAGYIEAGATLIETNTFAANPVRLEAYGMQARCAQINRLAAEVAREAAGDRALVAGSVGPLDIGLTIQHHEPAQLREAYAVQVQALREGGVDVLFLETFSTMIEAHAALEAAAATGVPVIFSIGGQALSRRHARSMVEQLADLGARPEVAAVGVNCVGPYDLSQILPIVAARTSKHLAAYPNAGIPSVIRGQVQYDLPPTTLLTEAEGWYQLGVSIFGGCCGTDTEHIRALAERFTTRTVPTRRASVTARVAAPAIAPRAPFHDPANPVRRNLTQGQHPLVCLEVNPGLNRPLPQLMQAVAPAALAGPDFFSVPDNAGANPSRDCMACAFLLQQRFPVPAIIHKTPAQANALHLHSYLLGAADLGIHGLLAVSGDPPNIGPFDRLASRVADIRNSVELLQLVARLRLGQLANGQPLPEPVDFAAGCVLAPALNLAGQVKWLHKKIEAGAEFVFTQPVFTADDIRKVRAHTAELRLPILFGVLPIASRRQIEFFRSGKIPGIVVPAAVQERIMRYIDAESQFKAGIDVVRELIAATAGAVDGFYLVIPFHRNGPAVAADLVSLIKSFRKSQAG